MEADQHRHPVPRQSSFECRLVEMRVAEGGEGCGPALHRRDKAVLTFYCSRHSVEPGLPDEVQGLLRLAPHRVDWSVPKEKGNDSVVHAVACPGKCSRLGCGAKGGPIEVDGRCDRLCPECNSLHRQVACRLIGDEAVFLDQVACKLGETVTVTVPAKFRTEHRPEPAKGLRGGAAHPVLQADVHHPAWEQAKQIEIGMVGGV